jgi:Ca-activated chloride channel family protein
LKLVFSTGGVTFNREIVKVGFVLFWALTVAPLVRVAAQNTCLTEAEAKKVVDSINSSASPSDIKSIRKELLQMRDEQSKLRAKITGDLEKNKVLIPEWVQMGEQHILRVCQILKEKGWLSADALQDQAYYALTSIIVDNQAYRYQRELLPVLVAASKKDYIEKPMLASLVDSIRVGFGLPQIFGTQASVKSDAVYILPILNEEKVDEWRKEYDLPPLAVQIRNLEVRYSLPVLKTQRRTLPADQKQQKGEAAVLGISEEESSSLKVETRIVNLNVRVLNSDKTPAPLLNLTKDDFSVLEDGVEQNITFFSAVDKPFDLVLLLDFSGSTIEKRSLIKKAAQRFVTAARAEDRIAVVAFANEIKIVADLTTNKDLLNQKIKEIELDGNSPIWDSLKFTYDNILKKESAGRRSAVVFMTDGEDGSKKTTFADLMEIVRHGDTTIFSVWLNTGFGSTNDEQARKYRRRLQTPLAMLTSETGGEIYYADDLKDLDGVYDQVINDLGRVYSIGYEPKNDIRDGGWRDLAVKIKTRPTLIAKTRRGYYAD